MEASNYGGNGGHAHRRSKMIAAGPARSVSASTWQILSTPPMSGSANMAYDLDLLQNVQNGTRPPTLRFFRWNEPTVSYGIHQPLEKIRERVPAGWKTVQRPTGGGTVFHGNDLCLSLCWRVGQPPIPGRLKDYYAWIHGVILKALQPLFDARLADCKECAGVPLPLAVRDCFTEPVGFDVLVRGEKRVGGALCRRQETFLYQGSVQGLIHPDLESHLRAAFAHALNRS